MNKFHNWLRDKYILRNMNDGDSRAEAEASWEQVYAGWKEVVNYKTGFWIAISLLVMTIISNILKNF